MLKFKVRNIFATLILIAVSAAANATTLEEAKNIMGSFNNSHEWVSVEQMKADFESIKGIDIKETPLISNPKYKTIISVQKFLINLQKVMNELEVVLNKNEPGVNELLTKQMHDDPIFRESMSLFFGDPAPK